MSLHINRTFFRRRGTLSYLQSYKKSPESVIVQNFSILRDPFKLPSFQLSIFKRKTKSLSQQEDDEIKMLEKFSRIVLVLKDQVQIGNDPICQKQVRHSSSIKKSLEETSNKYNSANILSLIEFKVDESLDKNIDSNVNYILDQPVDQILDQTILSELNFSLRAFLLKNYILQLKTAVNDGNVDESRITSDSLCRITDSFLFGTASERFAENLKLFGSSLSLFNTQYAFNMILEAEVSTAKDLLLTYKSIPKSYKKILPKFSTTFLHDKLEVNTKARCIVAWADPEFKGFQPIDENKVVNLQAILKGRNDFFKDGEESSSKFISDFIADRRMHYHDKRESRDNIRNGTIFFFATCFLDWMVCIM